MSARAFWALVLLCAAGPLGAQASSAGDTAHHAAVLSAHDTTKLVKPVAALWRSFVLPGWGQAMTGRNVTGAVFVTWEGVTMMMTLRAEQEEHYLSASGSPNVVAKRQQVQDWVVLWVFNHLFAGAEAFVAAHLEDFPKDLKLEAGPGGVAIRIPIP